MSGSGRIALVTGGGRGIGRAIALALAQDGADVAISYRRDGESAEETVSAIRSLGRRSLSCQASQEDFEALGEMVEEVARDLGPIDLLVNNAGIASRGYDVLHTEAAEVERVMRIHALAPHELCKRVLPGMREKERGDIIMISSVATRMPAANGAPYAMAKSAMEQLAFALAKEEQRHGIRVNVVAPGLVETEMGKRLIKATSGVDDMRKLDPGMPFGRVCQPRGCGRCGALSGLGSFRLRERSAHLRGRWRRMSGLGRREGVSATHFASSAANRRR